MKIVKKCLVIFLSLTIALLTMVIGTTPASAQTSSNIGLCAHCFTAYRECWSYVWGASSYGAVDCSGLIWSYNGVGGIRTDMLSASSEWGYVYNGVPNIHGLGLHHPGHVGVYVGSGMVIDAQSPQYGIAYHNLNSGSWVEWFKIAGVSYPYQGWVLLNGESFYYENGEYLVNTSRELDGVVYTFDGAGVSNIAPPDSAYEATDYSDAIREQPVNYYEEPVYTETYNDYYGDTNAQQEASYEPEPSIEPEPQPEPSVAEEPSVEPSKEESKKEESSKEESKKEESKKEESKAEAKKEEPEKEPETIIEIIAEYGYEDDETSKTVSSIQTRLYELGYLQEKADGYYGETTVNAVKLFQSRNDLEVTGQVDDKTNKTLKSNKVESNFSILKNGSFDEGLTIPVTALQTRLVELKYYYDDVTGFYGELTASAVRQFQKDNEMKVTGIADVDTQLSIFSSKAKKNPNAGSAVYGSSGAMITKLQKRLIELRYLSGIVSEKFDDATLEAVHAYQKASGLKETDLLTPEQLEVLYSDKAVRSPDYDVLKYGYAGDDIAQLQSRLAALKYYDGKTSGVYSNTVVAAVEKFQSDNDMDVTGNADEATQNLIKAEAQRQTTHVGEELILKTATITDDALAGIADSRSIELSLNDQATADTDPVQSTITLSAVFVGASALMIIFTKGLKRKSKAAQKNK